MINEKFIILAVLIDTIGTAIYLIDTLKGKAKPNKVSWFLWALIPMITFAGMLDEDASKTSLILTFWFSIMPLTVLIASFTNKKAYWKITNFDWLCGLVSILGIVTWLITSDGNLTILLALFANFMSWLPTLIKSVKFPETENGIAYLYAAGAASITLLTINEWTFASIAFPLYVAVTATILFISIKFKVGLKLIS